MTTDNQLYYVPRPCHWPFVGCLGVFVMLSGAGRWLHYDTTGPYLFFLGMGIIFSTLTGWFGKVIRESLAGRFSARVDRTMHLSMRWFIFTEAFFFLAFFGALFYLHYWVVPVLGGVYEPLTQILLWPDFISDWPLLTNPDNETYRGARYGSSPSGIPAMNTLVLLSSGITLTWAHSGLRNGDRTVLVVGLMLTVILGLVFLGSQATEYYLAYTEQQLTLNAGVYGSTFFMLTGFHGLHVTIGTTMLIVILIRSILGHFTPDGHFAFSGVAWYWHFVDVVWIALFIFVYWL